MKYTNKAEGKGPGPALRWSLCGLFMLLWSVGIGLAGLYFAARLNGYELFFSYLRSPLLLVLNCLPGLLLVLLVFGMTNRVWAGVLAGGAVVIGGALANYFKLQARAEPLLAADLRYITEAANISARYTLTITPAMIACFAAVAVAGVFAAIFLKTRFSAGKPRCIFVAAVLLAGAVLYCGVYRSERVYKATENIDVSFRDGHTLNQWHDVDQFCSRGFWYPFLHSTKTLGQTRPEGYRAEEAEALLSAYESTALTDGQKVSIVSVMLEAYADFSAYPQLEFTADPYEFFHELQAESISGELNTNTFAGETIDTERCYMTGSTQLYDYRAAADSYVRWFGTQGYKTQFCHPGYPWFYNRSNVCEYLGFDERYFGGDYFPIYDDGIPILDENFFPQVVDLLHEATADGSPCFSMSVTYQNHGPYAADYLYDESTKFVAQNDLSEAAYCILNNYFWGINRTDAALRTMVERLRDDSEPVVLVLFGDHKPWLGDGASVYTELGIDLTRESEASFYNYCRTPYVIWANNAAKAALGREFVGEGGDFSPCYLMMKVFDACGFVGDAYTNALRNAYPAVDLISPRLNRFRSGGSMHTARETLPADARNALEALEYMSYYRMNDAMR